MSEDKDLTSTNSSNKKDHVEEREEAKKRILYEDPHIPKDTLGFVLSLSVERKIPKVTELETIHATKEQQEELQAAQITSQGQVPKESEKDVTKEPEKLANLKQQGILSEEEFQQMKGRILSRI